MIYMTNFIVTLEALCHEQTGLFLSLVLKYYLLLPLQLKDYRRAPIDLIITIQHFHHHSLVQSLVRELRSHKPWHMA